MIRYAIEYFLQIIESLSWTEVGVLSLLIVAHGVIVSAAIVLVL